MNVRTRRASRPGRRGSPLALAVLAVVLIIIAAGLAACGGDEDGSASPTTPGDSASQAPSASPGEPTSPSPAATAAPATTVRVYFMRGEKLGVAERQVPQTKAVANAALTALCGGLTTEETDAGLTSAVPVGTELLGVSIRDGVATVDLSGEYASGGGSLSMMARVAQVVYTLTQFPTVTSVDFRMDGAPLTELGGEGLVLEPGQTRADWRDFEPALFVERPGVGAVLTSPFVLQGTAMVFEGAFLARLEDGSGRRLAFVPVQASAGGPERGDFRERIAYSTADDDGMLIVYDESAEDGSRQDEVRIPVTFAP